MSAPTFENAMLNWGRLLLDGIPYADLVAAESRGPDVTWLEFWSERATAYEALADDALAAGHERTAGEWLWLASLCCQYAQFLWFDATRAAVQARKANLYRRAAPLLRPAAERFDLPIDSTTIPGYIRVPETPVRSPVPCVILLGGLESTKEESYQFENLLLARGLATCTFDGPGQGEMLASVPLAPDFERYTSTVLDHVIADCRFDESRIAVLGRSLGGCYALRSASADDRFAACVSWGGFVVVDWDTEPSHDRASWQYVTNTQTDDEARDVVVPALETRPLLGDLRCPAYFLHGALDEMPMWQIDMLKEHAVNAELVIDVEPHGDHCCHNLGPAPRVRMADWLVDRLG